VLIHRATLALGVVAIGIAGTAHARTFTLETAVQQAVAGSDTVEVARAKTAGEQAKADEALMMFFPSATLTGGYARLDVAPYFDTEIDLAEYFPEELIDNPLIGPYFEDMEPMVLRMQVARQDNFQFQLQAEQIVFAGTGLHRQRAMTMAQLRSAKEEERAAVHEVAYQTEELFWQLAYAREAIEVTDAATETVDAYVDLLVRFVDVGLATEADLLTAQVQQASLELDSMRARQGAELAENAFRMLVHVPDGESIELDLVDGTMPLDMPLEIEPLTDLARAERPEARMLEQQGLAARHGAHAALSTWLPAVAFQANIYLKNPDRSLEPSWYWSGDLTVGLQWTLWDRGQAISRHRQARAGQRQVEAYQRQLHDGVKLEIEQALSAYHQADKQRAVAARAVDLAEKSLHLTELNFREGLARSVDVLEAQTALSKARLDAIGAEAAYRTAEAGLRRAIGLDLEDS